MIENKHTAAARCRKLTEVAQAGHVKQIGTASATTGGTTVYRNGLPDRSRPKHHLHLAYFTALLIPLCLMLTQPTHAQTDNAGTENVVAKKTEVSSALKEKRRPADHEVRYVIETQCDVPPVYTAITHATSDDTVWVTLLGTLGQMEAQHSIEKAANCRNYCLFLDAHTAKKYDWSVVGREKQSDDSQRWLIEPDGTGPDTYTIRQKETKKYLDAHIGSNDNSVVLRDRQGDDSQRWIIKPVSQSSSGSTGDDRARQPLNGLYTIQQKQGGNFLDAHIRQGDNNVVTRPDQKHDSQHWFIESLPRQNNIYEIAQKGSCWGKDSDRAQRIAMHDLAMQDIEKQILYGEKTPLANFGPVMAIQLSKPGSNAWYYGPVTVRYQIWDGTEWKDEVVSNFTKEGWLHNAAVGNIPAQPKVTLWEDNIGASTRESFSTPVAEYWQVIDGRHQPQEFKVNIDNTVNISEANWRQFNSEKDNELEVRLETRFRSEQSFRNTSRFEAHGEGKDPISGSSAGSRASNESEATFSASQELTNEMRSRLRMETRSEDGTRRDLSTTYIERYDEIVPKGTLLLKHVRVMATGDREVFKLSDKKLPIPVSKPKTTASVSRYYYRKSANTKELHLVDITTNTRSKTQNETLLDAPMSDEHKKQICLALGTGECQNIF